MTQSGIAKRNTVIDSIKGLGIWTVIFGHMLSPGNYVKSYLYSFHMPLFFSVYGMTYKAPENFKALVQRLIKRFFSYGVTYLLWAMFYCQFSPRNVLYVLWGTNDSLIQAQSSGVLWFLPCYFVAAALFEVVMFLFISKKRGLLLTFVIFLILSVAGYFLGTIQIISYRLPWGVDIALVATLFLWFGYFLKNHLLPILMQKKAVGIILTVLCAAACIPSVFIKTQAGYIRMANGDYGIFPAFLAFALCGIIFMSILTSYLDKIHIVSKCLNALGCYSLVIMVLQRDATNYYMAHIPQQYDSTVTSFAVSIVFAVILFVASYIISNLLPFLAGRRS